MCVAPAIIVTLSKGLATNLFTNRNNFGAVAILSMPMKLLILVRQTGVIFFSRCYCSSVGWNENEKITNKQKEKEEKLKKLKQIKMLNCYVQIS